MEKVKIVRDHLLRIWKDKHITKIFLLLFFIALLLSMLYFALLAKSVNVQALKEGLNQSTVIYDKDGDIASTLSTNRTKDVEIHNIPVHVKEAVVAIEDERFYEHNGFDMKGITRSFFQNIFARRITGGGSTITQQLTKNALLSPERTYKRKIEELFLAVEIEKHYEKDEILQMYLNQVYFGAGAWGIEPASKAYFNKEANDLTISEGALLAGLLQSPSARDPYKHYDQAINRRDVVIGKMYELGFISADEKETALKEKIKLTNGSKNSIEREYPYYVDAVLDEAINKYGLTQEEIFTRGYRIHTAMDQNLQSSLEKVYSKDSLFPRGRNGILVQSGAVLIDPKTGGVRGLVGGRGDYVFRGFNRATHMKAQPGSTLKPLAVYTPALESGYTITSTLLDEPVSYDDYSPKNATKTYRGEIPMYVALQDSLNVPAVRLLHDIGLEKGLDSLERFGIPLVKEDEHLGIALGGMYKGISPLKLAEAYSTFPNKGKRNEGHLITRIVGPTGNVIVEFEGKSHTVISKAVANNITSMLLNVVESGTGKGAEVPGIQIAGKTGSTQLPYNDINGTKDQWFVGYTPNLVGAVWLGYDNTDREHYLTGTSSENVLPIFRAIIGHSVPYIENDPFEVPSVNSILGDNNSVSDKNSLKKVKETTEQLEEKVKETTDKLEEKVKEESSKWPLVIEQMKEDFHSVKDKLKDVREKLIQ